MYYSRTYLKRKTPANGTDREEFISKLVDEYYSTTNIEAQEQVTANLANFAYDPLNWPFLYRVNALDLFLSLLESPNKSLQLHGISGLCNLSSDNKTAEFIIKTYHSRIITELFIRTEKSEILLQCLALFVQLLSEGPGSIPEIKNRLVTPLLLERVHHWRRQCKDQRVVNLCDLFIEDFGRRTEVVELQNAAGASDTMPSGQAITTSSNN